MNSRLSDKEMKEIVQRVRFLRNQTQSKEINLVWSEKETFCERLFGVEAMINGGKKGWIEDMNEIFLEMKDEDVFENIDYLIRVMNLAVLDENFQNGWLLWVFRMVKINVDSFSRLNNNRIVLFQIFEKNMRGLFECACKIMERIHSIYLFIEENSFEKKILMINNVVDYSIEKGDIVILSKMIDMIPDMILFKGEENENIFGAICKVIPLLETTIIKENEISEDMLTLLFHIISHYPLFFSKFLDQNSIKMIMMRIFLRDTSKNILCYIISYFQVNNDIVRRLQEWELIETNIFKKVLIRKRIDNVIKQGNSFPK